MKKIILAVAIAAISSTSFGQISFGLQVGANLAFGKAEYDYGTSFPGYSLTNDPKVGALAGFVAEIPFGKLAFRPELNFIQKGSKTNSAFAGFGGDIDKFNITLNYVELPLNVVYKLNMGNGNFFFGLGPSLAFGLSGKYKVSNEAYPGDPDYNYTRDIKFDGKKADDINDPNDDDKHLKRFDVGANVLAGYKLPMGVFFKLGYTYNFMNIDPDKDNALEADRGTYKNRGFNICVGYMLGGSKAKN